MVPLGIASQAVTDLHKPKAHIDRSPGRYHPGLVKLRRELYEQPCWLMGYGLCAGRTTGQHLIPKGATVNNGRVRIMVAALQVPCCMHHNNSKLADTPWARKVLLCRLLEWVDEAWLRDFLNGLPWKSLHHRFTFDAMMAAPSPPTDLTAPGS